MHGGETLSLYTVKKNDNAIESTKRSTMSGLPEINWKENVEIVVLVFFIKKDQFHFNP